MELTAHTLEIIQHCVLSIVFVFASTLLVSVVSDLVWRAFNVD